MRTLVRALTTQRTETPVSTLTPASASYTTAVSGPGMGDVLDMRVGCWRPPVHVTLT